MRGKGWLTSVGLCLGLSVLVAGTAQAVPVRPDVRKLLAEPQASPQEFAPARAGWEGPETPPATASQDPMLQSVSVKGRAQAMRASFVRAVVPDQRALAAVVAAIFILRRTRQRQQQGRLPTTISAPQRDQVQQAA